MAFSLAHAGILPASEGVSFNVPATVQCVPWQEAAPPAAVTMAVSNTAGPSNVRLASRRTPGTQSFLMVLDVTVIFAEPGRYDSIMFEVLPLSRKGTVVDYAPRTQATSDWVGEITQESVRNRNQVLNSNLNVGLPAYGAGALQFNNLSNENTVSRQSLKAPLTAVVTSGISQRGRGVFFRYRTTRESIIEGGHQLQVVWEVPLDWRGDLLQVHCVAQGPDSWVQRSYLTAVTIVGDQDTRELAEQFAAADHRADQVLARYHVTQRPTSFWADVESKLTRRAPNPAAVDPQRLRHSLLGATTVDHVAGFTELPTTLQSELRSLLQQKRAMLSLASSSP